jgi:O-antigen/teichoic acid export membrane protein
MLIVKKILDEILNVEGVKFYLLNRTWLLLSYPLTIILVLLQLDATQQGYYYTFLSILGYQALAEFGFNAGLIHFVANEWPKLKIKNGVLSGPTTSLNSLRSLLSIAFKWTFFISIFASIILVLIGYFFFHDENIYSQDWLFPWIFACIAIIFSFFSQTLKSIAEGVNNVHQSQRASLYGSIFSAVCAWLGLLFGLQLYVVSIAIFVNAFVVIIYLIFRLSPVLNCLKLKGSKGSSISWAGDFLPHQYKLGISFACGLAMFQSFVPFIFKFQGAEQAGQAGILLQVYVLINSIGLVWLTNAGPEIGRCWSKKNRSRIKKIVHGVLEKSIFTVSTLSLSAIFFVYALKQVWPEVAARAGSLTSLIFLCMTVIVMQFSNAFTTAVRYQKKECFLYNSIIGAILMLVSNYLLVQYSVNMVFVGYFVIMTFIVCPWIYWIYKEQIF